MSDAKRDASSQASPASAATEISFCPHLGIYRYRRADGVDYMFDTPQLEATIQSYIKAADTMQADFMAILTGFARKYPHQVVRFDAQGKCQLQKLEEQPPYPVEADPVTKG